MRKRNQYSITDLMKNGRRLLSVFLICALLAGMLSTAVYAGGAPDAEKESSEVKNEDNVKENSVKEEKNSLKKEEVVYATMSALGTVKDIYVVNSFRVPADGALEDYGNYSKVENLTDLNPIGYENDKVNAKVKKGRFYYQGDLDRKDLPWDIDISYTLDGREKEADEIGGAAGKIGIQIKTSKNLNVDPVYYERYILVVSVTLNAEICDHIKAKGAMAANAGSDKMFNFISMPEKDSTFNITLETENFSMKGITFAAMPATIDKDMIDLSQIDEMVDGLQQLADGISMLSGGAGALDEGMRQFSAGTDQLAQGLSEFNGGIEQLADGANQLNNGASLLRGGSSEFKSGLDRLNAGSDELAAGSAQINGVFQMIKEKSEEFGKLDTELLEKLRGILQKLYDWLIKAQEEFKDIVEQIKEQDLMSEFSPISEEELAAASAELARLAENGEISKATMNVYGRLVAGYLAAASVDQLIKNNEQIQQWSDEFLEALEKYINDLENVQIPKPEEIMKILEMVSTFADQYQMFHNGLVAYTDGVKALADGYNEIDSGIKGLQEGTAGISGGLNMTKDGSRQLADAAGEVAGGAGGLSGGMSELAGGIKELDSQTSGMPEKIRREIDDMLKKYTDPDFKPKSFVSEKNGNIEAVQFVFATEGIDGLEDDAEKENEPEEKSFWEKFLDLFK